FTPSQVGQAGNIRTVCSRGAAGRPNCPEPGNLPLNMSVLVATVVPRPRCVASQVLTGCSGKVVATAGRQALPNWQEGGEAVTKNVNAAGCASHSGCSCGCAIDRFALEGLPSTRTDQSESFNCTLNQTLPARANRGPTL